MSLLGGASGDGIYGKRIRIFEKTKISKEGMSVDLPEIGISLPDKKNLSYHIANLLREYLRAEMRKGNDSEGRHYSLNAKTILRRRQDSTPPKRIYKNHSDRWERRFGGKGRLTKTGKTKASSKKYATTYFYDSGLTINKMKLKKVQNGAVTFVIDDKVGAVEMLEQRGAKPIAAVRKPIDQGIQDYLDGCIGTREEASIAVRKYRLSLKEE